ncbi:MAG: glycine cleavage system protein GcvH [Verrucomicrobia bacterium]|nr:glycine cleavage system protein GcvH [Verrucomicrobiota bacterium]
MQIDKSCRYTSTHEWVRVEGDEVVVGISDFAQNQLSDITYVELPSVGDTLSAQDEVAVVESVKAASDIYAPIGGTVTEINDRLADEPEIINSDPYEEGWLFRMKPIDESDVEDLLDASQYESQLPSE